MTPISIFVLYVPIFTIYTSHRFLSDAFIQLHFIFFENSNILVGPRRKHGNDNVYGNDNVGLYSQRIFARMCSFCNSFLVEKLEESDKLNTTNYY